MPVFHRRIPETLTYLDTAAAAQPEHSYLNRVSDDLKARSHVVPGTSEGAFLLLYVLDNESLAEIRNATAHAFLSMALAPSRHGYRLYWVVYVKPISWLTPVYMAAIEPFRRWIVYPALLRRLRKAWSTRYARN
jgi:Protein of unknown function (DUF2867)